MGKSRRDRGVALITLGCGTGGRKEEGKERKGKKRKEKKEGVGEVWGRLNSACGDVEEVEGRPAHPSRDEPW